MYLKQTGFKKYQKFINQLFTHLLHIIFELLYTLRPIVVPTFL